MPARDEAPTVVQLVHPSGLSALLDGDALGPAETLVGGARVQVGPHREAELAPELLANGVVAAARTDGGFVFLDQAGDLWRARSFLGSLERVGTTAVGPFTAGSTSLGRITIRSESGLFSTSGSLPPSAVALPSSLVIDLAFLDAQHGAAALDGGQLAWTDDGGAHFRALDLGAPALSVVAHAGALLVHLAPDRWVRLDADARALDASEPPATTLAPGDDAAVGRTLMRALPALALAPYPTRALAIDGAVYWRRGASDLERIDGSSGRSETLSHVLPGDCYVYRWGDWIAAHCDGSLASASLHRSRDGRHFERVASIAPGARVMLSADGHSAAWTGGCPGRASTDLCVVREAHAWRPERHELEPDRWSAPRGDWMLGRRGDVHRLVVVQLSRGSRTTPFVPPPHTARVAALSSDGARLAIVASESPSPDEDRVLFVGPPQGPLVQRPLPSGARAVGFLDARRGIAVGVRADQLWRTLDGGERWDALPSPVRGDASSVHVANTEDELVGGAPECDAMGCWVGSPSVVTVRGWGPIAPVAYPALVGGEPSGDADIVPSTMASVRLVCASEPAPSAPPAPSTRARSSRPRRSPTTSQADSPSPASAVEELLSDGRRVTLLGGPTDHDVTVSAIATDGTASVLRRLWFANDAPHAGLARLPNGSVEIVAIPSSGRGFLMASLAADALPRLVASTAELVVCPSTAPTGASIATLTGGPELATEDSALGRVWRTTIALWGDHACVLRVELGSDPAQRAGSTSIAPSADGAFVGMTALRDPPTNVRCTLER